MAVARRREPIPDVPPRLGPCEDLRFLGHGSMGAVFRARHVDLDREVAVKVVNPRLAASDPVMLQRFVREVRLLKKVDDPHVVKIIDAGHDGRFTYAVMELIVGQSLKRLKEVEGRLAPDAVAYYLAQVARGLHAVHRQGIVHRDVKPENMMIDTTGRAKLADFGLARGHDSQQLTMLDEVVGTPEYMAPEAIQQREVDGRSDIYSLGISAWELLTGSTPFNQGGVLRVVQDHLQTPVPALEEVRPEVPAALADVVRRLVEKDPDDRYATAAEVAEALGALAPEAPPHQATPEVRLEGARMPSWEELFLVRLLSKHRIYPLETLLEGLWAWRQLKEQPPFVVFLTQRANLPVETARKANAAARQALINLRNRIARTKLRSSGRYDRQRIDDVERDRLPEGTQLPSHLAQRGLLSPADADALDRAVNRTLRQATDRALEKACAAVGVAHATLPRLEGDLDPEVFGRIYRELVRSLVEQL